MIFSAEALGEKLRAARQADPPISQHIAARIAEVSVRQWGLYERGKFTPPLEVLIKFAQARKIRLDSLIPISDDIPGLLPDIAKIDRVPIVNRIPASGFITSYDDTLIDEWIATTYSGKKDLFALIARGDSMSPKIENGDRVICSPHEEFQNDKIYAVVTTDSEHTLKVVRKARNEYFCIPLNPAYKPLILDESQVLRLIRVVEILKKA